MADSPRPKPWIALDRPTIEPRPKQVVEDENFYIGKLLTQRQIEELDRIRGLIAVGGDLGPYYRRSKTFDELLRRQRIMHLHLGGPGSDAILYLIRYPEHVLFLCIDGHVHLDDVPPGKRIPIQGRKTFERRLEVVYAERIARIRASVAVLMRRPKPK